MIEPMPLHAQARRYGLLPAQLAHRLDLFRDANIKDGDRILEIGCGQGDCTSALALFYPNSHITAVDPGPSDYGRPETLGQAHERIRGYDIGSRIEFVQATPIAHLKNVEDGTYDIAVICHSLWYFSDKEEVRATMEALRGKVKRLFIAEWALKSCSREGDVHVQIACTRATCEAHIPDSRENIRTLLSPGQIKQCVIDLGWSFQRELINSPSPLLEDARWELYMLLEKDVNEEYTFMKRVKDRIQEERIQVVLESMLESVKSSVESFGGIENVACMDVWVGMFEQGSA
ncbi:S-adenosyl-L-methionine-dependent methyltransferase [Karstenula rhodostoma CBS 690.94]|uniref:S-adenosyl-L-methionine-dependent methyltransferase n=1 Tax=Karstenula rhodostoma CBS 690.94 TaxID=1392251 RepID=A0A9P4PFX5_9PLEO|nr:S-adenosyl-L-methionine-dependent methyltransferase [Karstenula rhodostoma CBS 690.94]